MNSMRLIWWPQSGHTSCVRYYILKICRNRFKKKCVTLLQHNGLPQMISNKLWRFALGGPILRVKDIQVPCS